MRPAIWLERIWQDLRLAVRVLARSPGFTAIAVLSIALGTGANVSMFSAADALLLRPLPVARPNELVTVGSKVLRAYRHVSAASYPDYLDIRDRSHSFDGLVAFASRGLGFAAHAGEPPRLKSTTFVSENFFRVLGVPPEIGRDFLPQEHRRSASCAAILSYGAWQTEFAADRSALGRSVRIGAADCIVVGVAPAAFTGLNSYVADTAYVPLATWTMVTGSTEPEPLTMRDIRFLTLKGRLRHGTSLRAAQAELAVIATALSQAYPDTNKGQTLTAQTEMATTFERNPLDSALLVLLTTLTAAVLCVACANVAGLLASRAPVRAREIALRLAIGAGRWRLVRQLLTESVAIALAGGLGGVAVGYVGIVLLGQIHFPSDVVSVPAIRLDRRALSFSVLLAGASALLFGLGPALQTTRVNLTSAIKSIERGRGSQRLTWRNVLVAIQVALSLVLLTIAVFTLQVFQRELADGPGFRTTHIAKLSIDTSQTRSTLTQSAQFFERALENTRRLPGVRSAAVTSAMPLWSGEIVSIVPEGYHLPEGTSSVRLNANSIDESYLETMSIPLVAGRGFRSSDTAGAARVAIVNEALARHYWPGERVVGRRFRMGAMESSWIEIVGVVKTTQYLYAGEPPRDMVYFPFRQVPHQDMVLLAETAGESAELLMPLREMVFRMHADVLVYDVQTIETFYAARTTSIAHVLVAIITGIGVMGMALTMVGLYGLVSYSVSRRTREIGIRIAVGATHGSVLRLIVGQGMIPAWAGLAVGLVLSVVTRRMLPAFVLVNQRYDWDTYLMVIPTLLAVTLIAAYVPARQAARVDPTIALRCE